METYEILLATTGVLTAALLITVRVRRGPEDSWFVSILRLVNDALARFLHRLEHIGPREPLPPTGPCIVVANHRSGADPNLVAAATRRWIRFLMAREFYEIRGMHWIFRGLECIPVSRDGNDLRAMRRTLEVLRAGRVIGIFPQGGIRDPDDELDVGKAGVALFAARSGAPVVPFFIEGSPLCESAATAVFRFSRSRVYCGEPLRFPETEGKPTREQLDAFTGRILLAISELRERAQADSSRDA